MRACAPRGRKRRGRSAAGHGPVEDFKAGAYQRLERLQGQRATYFAGEICAGIGVAYGMEYAASVIERFFAEPAYEGGARPAAAEPPVEIRTSDRHAALGGRDISGMYDSLDPGRFGVSVQLREGRDPGQSQDEATDGGSGGPGEGDEGPGR